MSQSRAVPTLGPASHNRVWQSLSRNLWSAASRHRQRCNSRMECRAFWSSKRLHKLFWSHRATKREASRPARRALGSAARRQIASECHSSTAKRHPEQEKGSRALPSAVHVWRTAGPHLHETAEKTRRLNKKEKRNPSCTKSKHKKRVRVQKCQQKKQCQAQ